jgi:phosphohistidine phosphatase
MEGLSSKHILGSPSGDGGFKVLFLIRHAKSSWETGLLSDFDRPLNERGKKDAPEMAARLKNKKYVLMHLYLALQKELKKPLNYFVKYTRFLKNQFSLYQHYTMHIAVLFLM